MPRYGLEPQSSGWPIWEASDLGKHAARSGYGSLGSDPTPGVCLTFYH